MNINDFYIHAIRAKAHYKRHWVLRAFSITQEDPESWKNDPQPWRIVRTLTNYSYVNEQLQLVPIEGSDPSVPLYGPEQLIEVPKNFFEFWPEGGDTTPGNLLFNATALWPSVGGLLGFINDEFSMGSLEAKFAVMKKAPANDADRVPTDIYVDQYLRFCNAVVYLEEFTQIFTVSVNLHAFSPPPGLAEFKKALIEKHKDKLNDPLTQTIIYKELVEFAKDYLRGDPSERFLISSKSIDTVYRKLFLILGGDAGLDTSTLDMNMITNSLVEGWDMEHFTDMVNTARAGSYDRGTETELAGVIAKWLERTTANVRITIDDCNTKAYKVMNVMASNYHRLAGKWLVKDNGIELVKNEEEASKYLGKVVNVRAPHFCAGGETDYCKICLGVNLSANPNAPSAAATTYGGDFLKMFLSAMHAKVIKTATVELKEIIS